MRITHNIEEFHEKWRNKHMKCIMHVVDNYVVLNRITLTEVLLYYKLNRHLMINFLILFEVDDARETIPQTRFP